MLRVSAPRVHCGWLREQQRPPPPPECTGDEADDAVLHSNVGGNNDEQTYIAGSSTGNGGSSIPKRYIFWSDGGDRDDDDDIDGEDGEDGGPRMAVVRMEDYVLVDRSRRGGNDAICADELEQVLVVMCDGHGAMSMLGARHPHELHLGAAEMARLGAHSLLNELDAGATVEEAFSETERRLKCASFDGAARHSSTNESLLDGAYFRHVPEPILLNTVVSKTCELLPTSTAPVVRYVRQSGQRVDSMCGMSATVLQCIAQDRIVRCANVGAVLAALFVPSGRDAYTYEWLTEAHTVHNSDERSRLECDHGVRVRDGAFTYTFEDPAVSTDVFRLSRALGHQAPLRQQGMLDKPSVVQVRLDAGQWIVVGTSGFWRALHRINDDEAATSVATHLVRARDPNAVADRLLDAALHACEKENRTADNIALVVISVGA